jgi:hypothetical protein
MTEDDIEARELTARERLFVQTAPWIVLRLIMLARVGYRELTG